MENIEVGVVIAASLQKVWNAFTDPKHIMNWNFAGDDWHCPTAESEFKVGGRFSYNMAAKDGSFAFDLWGFFEEIQENKSLTYSLGEASENGRRVWVTFKSEPEGIKVTQRFVPEEENSLELQQQGWQMILDNFKKYCENSND